MARAGIVLRSPKAGALLQILNEYCISTKQFGIA